MGKVKVRSMISFIQDTALDSGQSFQRGVQQGNHSRQVTSSPPHQGRLLQWSFKYLLLFSLFFTTITLYCITILY